MKSWRLVSACLLASATAGAVALMTLAVRRWASETDRIVERLDKRDDAAATSFSHDNLAGLPEPVVRYFDFALTPDQRPVSKARFEQRGEFAMRPDSWSPFRAVEYFSVEPRGFLWDADIRFAGMLPMCIRDGYVGGEGAMVGMLAAIVPLVNQRGTSQMAEGELLRYLAELVMLPTALLPGRGISWKPLGETTAEVTLADGSTTVSCTMHFGERGEIVRISAMRYFANGSTATTPWVGHFRDYRRIDGMMIPMSADVEWVLPDGPFPYWRGRIINARYEFAR